MSILVSVPVLTYNAAEFVEETLESIYNQTYQNIQLIISDDCSKDNTVEIVEKWCAQERVKARFTAIKIITVPKNTGVSANCNRCIKAATSEWIKFIAGDDILLPNCIADNMDFVSKQPDASIIFSQVGVYQDTFSAVNYQKSLPKEFPMNLMDSNFSAKDQFAILLESDRINYTPSYFFNKKALVKVGLYDETNTLVEDYPMWLKITKSGEKLYYFHKQTVGYRIHSKATNNTGENLLFKPSVINSYLIRKKYVHQYLPWITNMNENWVYFSSVFFKRMGIIKATSMNVFLYKFISIYCNPFFYLNSISKKLK
jgi:alpha-1,3-rhamnosyltransferase